VNRSAADGEAEPGGVGLERGTVGDVHARDAVEAEPQAGELERRAVADLEAERVAVERPRRLEVVREHEQVVEAVQRHQPRTFMRTIPYPSSAASSSRWPKAVHGEAKPTARGGR
jgi:hypothetical protein